LLIHGAQLRRSFSVRKARLPSGDVQWLEVSPSPPILRDAASALAMVMSQCGGVRAD